MKKIDFPLKGSFLEMEIFEMSCVLFLRIFPNISLTYFASLEISKFPLEF